MTTTPNDATAGHGWIAENEATENLEGLYFCKVNRADRETIAYAYGESADEAMKIAALMASAPALLAACKSLAEEFLKVIGNCNCDACQRSLAVIADARRTIAAAIPAPHAKGTT